VIIGKPPAFSEVGGVARISNTEEMRTQLMIGLGGSIIFSENKRESDDKKKRKRVLKKIIEWGGKKSGYSRALGDTGGIGGNTYRRERACDLEKKT